MECAWSSEFRNDGMSWSVTEKGSELSVIQGSTECVKVRGWVRRESPDREQPSGQLKFLDGKKKMEDTLSSLTGMSS